MAHTIGVFTVLAFLVPPSLSGLGEVAMYRDCRQPNVWTRRQPPGCDCQQGTGGLQEDLSNDEFQDLACLSTARVSITHEDNGRVGHRQTHWHSVCHRALVFVLGQKLVFDHDLSLLKQGFQQCLWQSYWVMLAVVWLGLIGLMGTMVPLLAHATATVDFHMVILVALVPAPWSVSHTAALGRPHLEQPP